jgi:polyribonucleotide nucleotidyltransferase
LFQVVREATELGQIGLNRILDIMDTCITAPRVDKTNLPVNETINVPAHKRGKFIGPGGINLKRLTSDVGVRVMSSDEGVFTLFAPNREAMAEARCAIHQFLRIILNLDS